MSENCIDKMVEEFLEKGGTITKLKYCGKRRGSYGINALERKIRKKKKEQSKKNNFRMSQNKTRIK